MRTLVIFIAILLASGKSLADCGAGHLEFWPREFTVSENTLFVIDGYSLGQKIIIELNKKYPIYLRCGNLKVDLQVKEILFGEGSLTQVILVPIKDLIPGNIYQLCIDNIPHNEIAVTNYWNVKTEKYKFPAWQVQEGRDKTKPLWILQPKEEKKTFIDYGCGLEYYVYFNLTTLDQSEVLIRTSVTSKSNNKTFTFYLKPEDRGTLKVGRGMCGGAFNFTDGEHFDVTFDIMDASGNIAPWTGQPITFTKPHPSK